MIEMAKKSDASEITEYQGSALKTPIKFSFEWEEYPADADGINAAKAAGDWPNEGGILRGINASRKVAARQKAYVESTKTLREAYEKTREYKVKTLTQALIATGKSAEEAAKIAEQLTPQE